MSKKTKILIPTTIIIILIIAGLANYIYEQANQKYISKNINLSYNSSDILDYEAVLIAKALTKSTITKNNIKYLFEINKIDNTLYLMNSSSSEMNFLDRFLLSSELKNIFNNTVIII